MECSQQCLMSLPVSALTIEMCVQLIFVKIVRKRIAGGTAVLLSVLCVCVPACYGIVQVPTGPWFCRKCESQERAARVVSTPTNHKTQQVFPVLPFPGHPRWTLTSLWLPSCPPEVWAVPPQRWCPQEDRQWRLDSPLYLHDEILWSFVYWQGGFEIYFPISSSGWAHVVCALYIPEVQFANVLTMEPIILQYVPHERYLKVHTSMQKWPQHTEKIWRSHSFHTKWKYDSLGKQSFYFDLDHKFLPQYIKVDFYQTFTPGTSASAYNGCVEGMSCIPQQQYQQQWCVLFDRQNSYIRSDLKDCVWPCAAVLSGELGSCYSVFFSETQTSVVQPPAVLQIS